MLAEDKLYEQTTPTSWEEEESNLYHENIKFFSMQAVVMANLDMIMAIGFNPPPDKTWGELEYLARLLRMIYYGMLLASFCANLLVVCRKTTLSFLGVVLYDECGSIFRVFVLAQILAFGSMLFGVWVLLEWKIATFCWIVFAFTCREFCRGYQEMVWGCHFENSQAADLRETSDAPAANTGVYPMAYNNQQEQLLHVHGFAQQKPHCKQITSKNTLDGHCDASSSNHITSTQRGERFKRRIRDVRVSEEKLHF